MNIKNNFIHQSRFFNLEIENKENDTIKASKARELHLNFKK